MPPSSTSLDIVAVGDELILFFDVVLDSGEFTIFYETGFSVWSMITTAVQTYGGF